MPTHLVSTSVAHRLDAGTYSACIVARRPVAAPSRPVASPFARMAAIAAPYLGSALLGALLAMAYGVTP